MTLDLSGVLADAWTLWKRDRDLLVRVAGPFLFLPSYALSLLLPPLPAFADAKGGGELSGLQALSDAVAANLGWYLLAFVLSQFGLATILALYLDPERPALGAALARATRILPRYLLASMLVALPVIAGLFLLVIPALIALGRLMMVGPVLLGEGRVGAAGALVRSVALTRGNTLAMTGLASLSILLRYVAGAPFAALETALRGAAGGPNPVALAIVDGAGSAVDAVSAVAALLISVAAYRRLASSRGT